MSERLVLATDLDGTIAGGSDAARAELAALLTGTAGVRFVYVTGRTPPAAEELITRVRLPTPDVLIADVGTSVLRGAGPDHVRDIEAELGRTWPGASTVRARLAAVDVLAPQDIDAPRRVSYWIEPVRRRRDAGAPAGSDPFAAPRRDDVSMDAESARIAERAGRAAAEALDGLDVGVLVSANVFLDVLPRGVDKGTTLRRVLRWLDRAEDDCVVAGDSLNDLALFETGLRGIVVGNGEPALRRRVTHLEQVYTARADGAGGVLEGLRHHGYFRDATTPTAPAGEDGA